MGAKRSNVSDALNDYLAITDPKQREAWMASLHDRDPLLANEVQSLAVHVRDDGFLEKPATPLHLDFDEEGTVRTGSVVAGYELLSQIGEGGFGLVFSSRRIADGDLSAVVKLLRESMLSTSALARFEREQEVLSRLTHPGIAHLRTAGVLQGGTPYLVMDYVRGMPLTAFADNAKLTLHERVAIVASILDAVGYAHQRGVIHRDLKPSNLLAYRNEHGAPEAVVIDFGIAKLFDERPGGVTTTSQALGTEAYSSPEQLRHAGRNTGPASDIHSLGVVLAELLLGDLPWKADTTGSFRDAVLRDLPDLKAEASKAPIPAPLQAVIHQALRKDPADRFASAEEFAAELRRWLSGNKVRTPSLSLRYRTRHFCGRYRTLVLASVAIAITLVVGTVASLRFALLASARNRALETQQALTAMQAASQALRTGERVAAEALLATVPQNQRDLTWNWLTSRAKPATVLSRELGQACSLAIGDGCLVVGTMGGVVRCMGTDGAPRWKVDAHTKPVVRMETFILDGRKFVASVGSDGMLVVIDMEKGEITRQAQVSDAGLSGLAIDREQGVIWAGGERGLYKLELDATLGAGVVRVNMLDVAHVAILENKVFVATRKGDVIALADDAGSEAWRTSLGREWLMGCVVLEGLTHPPLAVSNTAGIVWLIDAASGDVLDQLVLAKGAAHDLAWDATSRRLTVAGKSGTVCIASVVLGRSRTFAVEQSFRGHGASARARLQGARLYSTSWSGELLAEELGSEQTLEGHSAVLPDHVAISSHGHIAMVDAHRVCHVALAEQGETHVVSLPEAEVGAITWVGRDESAGFAVLSNDRLCIGGSEGWQCWPHDLGRAARLLAANGNLVLAGGNKNLVLAGQGEILAEVTCDAVCTAVAAYDNAFVVALSDGKLLKCTNQGELQLVATLPDAAEWIGECGCGIVALNAKGDSLHLVADSKLTSLPLGKPHPSALFATHDSEQILLAYTDGSIAAINCRTFGVVEVLPSSASRTLIAVGTEATGTLRAVSASGNVVSIRGEKSK